MLHICITNSTVNFTWFMLLTHQIFVDRPLFKPGALCFLIKKKELLLLFEIASKHFFFHNEINFQYKPISNHTEFIYGKNNSEKKKKSISLFSKTSNLVNDLPSCVCFIYIYIYIYILSLRKKTKTGYFRIINLFPSCFVFLM